MHDNPARLVQGNTTDEQVLHLLSFLMAPGAGKASLWAIRVAQMNNEKDEDLHRSLQCMVSK
jgi:hypothetical protein